MTTRSDIRLFFTGTLMGAAIGAALVYSGLRYDDVVRNPNGSVSLKIECEALSNIEAGDTQITALNCEGRRAYLWDSRDLSDAPVESVDLGIQLQKESN